MASLAPETMHHLVEAIGQSPPVDTTAPYNRDGVSGKTILVTGGASGFGAAFAREWAGHGANLILGDVNDKMGEELVAELRASTGSSHHHYIHCDVTDWQSQVAFFRTAAQLSPTGGIDGVVANAGIVEKETTVSGKGFENPSNLDTDPNPPPPNLDVVNVNFIGVLYTTHLALFWLPRNGAAKQPSNSQPNGNGATDCKPSGLPRDRHLLLVGSIAGIAPLPCQTGYAAAKHAVTGLFRSLRATVRGQGIRVNMICPYFVATPIIPKAGLLALAGGAPAELEDVVDAATRLMADDGIVGRALCIGPKIVVVPGQDGAEDTVKLVEGEGQAVWECYAQDYESVEVFVWRMVRLLNTVRTIRGWVGLVKDTVRILFGGR
ncbi:Bacilysin biosynthesis oxidoreductase [Pleurostoma richardsiae]|uniref:Bacilysin biosynthesis oxidoreductase n=1 Tax=Pleurostoma richardsiae TaxID=41990 RepID=A0AA38S3E4_9PEZI|nr:Bacilysin biosynthesis oxidoreductase [Pleurostoma richardsiae]